jgi:hypothetical protein
MLKKKVLVKIIVSMLAKPLNRREDLVATIKKEPFQLTRL